MNICSARKRVVNAETNLVCCNMLPNVFNRASSLIDLTRTCSGSMNHWSPKSESPVLRLAAAIMRSAFSLPPKPNFLAILPARLNRDIGSGRYGLP